VIRWTDQRKAELRALIAEGHGLSEIGRRLDTTRNSIVGITLRLGLKARPKHRRRSFAAADSGTTRFTSRRFAPADRKRLLVDGFYNSKIANRETAPVVMKGKWKDFPIFTLALVERETCPKTCAAWRICYGDNMQAQPRIIAGPDLEAALWKELHILDGKHPNGFVVRLHVLGDFYSLEYLELWERALDAFPPLHVFGYTARDHAKEPIGRALYRLAQSRWDRFAMRFSGQGLDRLGAEIIEPGKASPHVVCPMQTGRTDCCATCGFCWQGTKTVAFYEH
jgi:hypothetical protein